MCGNEDEEDLKKRDSERFKREPQPGDWWGVGVVNQREE